ncbi:MAG TPA: cytochrome d ubiquinol oxidase subunit II [Spirochaetes bacterium]|nr:cytochrome d ubiquinol oxidase subunit II [Spirochaetota bacterium]
MDVLQNIWYFIIGFLFIGYAVLDGFDLGIGSLMPVLAKNDEEKLTLFNSIWPLWDGNEVWLVTAGAALFAAFPYAYATVFSGFYLALMLVLFALIFRAVSIEFWYYDEKRRPLWSITFFLGSIIPSLLFGVALGNIIVGIPLDANTDFTGNFFTLLRPYPLSLGVLGLSAIFMQGCTYTMMKTEGPLQNRARALGEKLWLFFIIALALSFIMTLIYMPASLARTGVWLGAVVTVLPWILNRSFIKKGMDARAFFMSSLSFAGLWILAGATHYPNLVKARNDPGLSLTIANASSTELTLKVMLGIALSVMPIVLIYSVFVHRVFRGKAPSGYGGH